jgi:hypothetical protein
MKRFSLLLADMNSHGVRAVVDDVADGSTDAASVGVRCEEWLSGLSADQMFLDAADRAALSALVRPHLITA